MELRHQALEDERRRREQLERQLQDETAQRQQLIEREVKMREKQLAQVCRSPSRTPGGQGCHGPLGERRSVLAAQAGHPAQLAKEGSCRASFCCLGGQH